jgi:hypothetical protein
VTCNADNKTLIEEVNGKVAPEDTIQVRAEHPDEAGVPIMTMDGMGGDGNGTESKDGERENSNCNNNNLVHAITSSEQNVQYTKEIYNN